MECNKHISFKDLQDYVKRLNLTNSDYFTQKELSEIRKILNVYSKSEIESIDFLCIKDTYENILRMRDLSELKTGVTYVITDYQTFYNISDLEIESSKQYNLVLQAVSNNSFNPIGVILVDDKVFLIEYSIEKETLKNGMYSKGKILFMKDDKNNSAFYDFINTKFRRTKDELLQVGILIDDNFLDYYTFNNQCENIELGKDCYNNIFLNKSENIRLFENSSNNTFKDSIENLQGILIGAKIFNKNLPSVLKYATNSGADNIISYLDKETLAFQSIKL